MNKGSRLHEEVEWIEMEEIVISLNEIKNRKAMNEDGLSAEL